jgi:plastocyanin
VVKTKFLLLSLYLFCCQASLAASISGKITILSEKDGQWTPSSDHSDAVVFLTGEASNKSQKKKKKEVVMKEAKFDRRVLAVEVGDTVSFPNRDVIYHNVWSLSKTKPFDLGTYKAPEERSVTFDKPGLVKVFCNIHPEMILTVLVMQNSHYAITKKNGSFKLDNIPPGDYQLRVWVEGQKPETRKLTLKAKSKAKVKMKVKRKLTGFHLNKDGKPYKDY